MERMVGKRGDKISRKFGKDLSEYGVAIRGALWRAASSLLASAFSDQSFVEARPSKAKGGTGKGRDVMVRALSERAGPRADHTHDGREKALTERVKGA